MVGSTFLLFCGYLSTTGEGSISSAAPHKQNICRNDTHAELISLGVSVIHSFVAGSQCPLFSASLELNGAKGQSAYIPH